MNAETFSNPMPQQVPLCARHPDRAAQAPCSRCGTFGCDDCLTLKNPPLCADCADRRDDVLGVRGDVFTFGSALRNAFTLWREAIGPMLLVGLPFALADGAATYFLEGTPVERLATVAINIVSLIATGARYRLLHAAATGGEKTVRSAFRTGTDRFGAMFGANWRAGWIIFFFTLLLIVPGVLRALSYALVAALVVIQPDEDPLRRSRELTHGHRGALLGLFAIGVALWIGPVFVLAFAGFFVTEAVPAMGLPVSLVTTVISMPGEALVAALACASLYGLQRSERLRNG